MSGDVIDFFRKVPAENAGGSPAATAQRVSIADELRAMAQALDDGKMSPLTHLICIPVDAIGTSSPHLMGERMTIVEMVGRLEISKSAVLNSLWDAAG